MNDFVTKPEFDSTMKTVFNNQDKMAGSLDKIANSQQEQATSGAKVLERLDNLKAQSEKDDKELAEEIEKEEKKTDEKINAHVKNKHISMGQLVLIISGSISILAGLQWLIQQLSK